MNRVTNLPGQKSPGRGGSWRDEVGVTEAVVDTPQLTLPYLGRLLPRPRLRELLPEPGEGGVVMVTAGPGYGKTAFVADAFRAADVPGAYYCPTGEDRDPSRFLESLTATLAKTHEGFGGLAMERLAECRDVESEVLGVTSAIAQEMAAVAGATYLAIDDVHEVEDSPAVVAALSFLVEALPQGWTLFLLSRRPLPADLGHVRFTSRIVEIGLRQLRLTPGEISLWTRDRWGIELGPAEARSLWKVTEGWPVALTLVGERHKRCGRLLAKQDVVDLLRRGDRLREYLASAVFELFDPRTAEILLAASVLPRVVFPRDANFLPGEDHGSEAALAELVESGLLVTRVGHRTFVMHPLLRGYARRRLADLGTGYSRRLLRDAAAHLESHGELLAAVSLYLKAGETTEVLRPLRAHVSRHLDTATTFAGREWLSLVPESIADEDPWMKMVRARVLQDEGRYEEAQRRYQEAARQFAESGDRMARFRALMGRVFCLFLSARWEEGAVVAEEAESIAQTKEERAEALTVRGHLVLGQCRWDEAVELFEIALATVPAASRPALEARISIFRARLFFLRGRYRTATEWAERAIRQTSDGPRHTYAAALNTASTLEYLQGHYEQARLHADSALAYVRAREYGFLEAPILLTRAAILMGEENYRVSFSMLKEAVLLSESAGDVEAVVWALDLQADLCRRNRNPEKAAELRTRALALMDEKQISNFERLRALCGQGADMAVAGREGEAAELLAAVLKQCRRNGMDALAAQALFYSGWLAARRGCEAEAARQLTEATSLAEDNGYVHFLLQEARVAVPILALAARLGDAAFLEERIVPSLPDRLQAYYRKLAAGPLYPTDVALGSPRYSRSQLASRGRRQCTEQDRQTIHRIEDLTDREFEILTHIASGLPNKVIAARLFITEKTIKTHSNRVYRKLGVTNRLQAVLMLQDFERLSRLGHGGAGNTLGD